MSTITISKKEYNLLKRHSVEYLKVVKKAAQDKSNKSDKDEEITEDSILRLAREAKRLYRAGKLPLLHSLKELR